MLFNPSIYLLQLFSDYGRQSGMSWTTILLLVLIFLILVGMFTGTKTITPTSHWHHHFDNFNYSSQEFYEAIEATIKDKQISGISMQRAWYSQEGILSAKREYLYVKWRQMVFVICAAPFAKSFFVSWWFSEKPRSYALIALIPYFGPGWVKKLQTKSLFQLDTEQMYKSEIHSCVVTVMNTMTEAKGMRGLTREDCVIQPELIDAAYAE